MKKTLNNKWEDNLFLIKTNKYKTIDLYLTFSNEHDPKKHACLKAISYFLGSYSLKYPTKNEMHKAKSNLYLANISSEIDILNNLINFNINYSFVNPSFLDDVKIEDFIDYFDECLRNIYFDEKILVEYKKNYKDSIKRKYDNPSTYINIKTNQILAKEDELLKPLDNILLKEVEELNIEDIKKEYFNLFNNYELRVFLIGDYDEELLNYAKSFKNNRHYQLTSRLPNIKKHLPIIERKKLGQSILNVFYKTPYNRYAKDFYAALVTNCLLGALPTSLLFEEIREKHSYCYFIFSEYVKCNGIIKISTAIDGKNYLKVRRLIKKQIKRLINKDFSEHKLEVTKKLLIDNINQTIDDLSWFQDFALKSSLYGVFVTIDEYKEAILKVNRDDISRVAKNYQLVLTYLLKGN